MDLPPPQAVCIAQVVHAEARGESVLGQRAVGHVIINRSKKLKKTPCEIIRQPGQFQVKLKQRYRGESWRKAYSVAYNLGKDVTGGALYFVKRGVQVTWNARITTSIGHHNFYK